MKPVTLPSTQWVNLNLHLVPIPNKIAPRLTRQEAVTSALQLSNFLVHLRSNGWHLTDQTIE